MNTTDRLKVVRLIARLNVGGPARQAILLHQRLPELGFDTVLVHGEVAPGEASLESLLNERRLSSVKLHDLGARLNALSDIRAFVDVVRVLFAARPDVLHTHTAKAGSLGRLAAAIYNATRARRSRCLVVHTFHGNVFHGYFNPVASAAVRVIERGLARLTDCVIAISPRQRQEIVERFRVARPDRVAVVRLGLELDRFMLVGPVDPALRQELGFPASCVLFGSIGRLVPIKDLGTLLRALAVARRSCDARLVIAGDGPERQGLEALALSLGLADAVRFIGWRHDLERLYEGIDVVVLSSRNEGTPVTLIEAMSAARPVLATAVGGVPDVVEDGRSGYLVPTRDPTQLGERMARLASSPEERQRMGAAGRAASERFQQRHLLDALAALYREELTRRRGRRAGAGETAARV